MAAINAFQALNSYRSYNSMFSLTKGPISSDGPVKPTSYTFARYAASLFTTTAANGLANILASANQLNNTLSSLQNNGPASLLATRVAVSSDPVSVKANTAKGADFQNVHINVQSIATAQSNSGAAFNDSAPTSLQTGTQKFTSGAQQSSYSNEIQLEHGKITATLLNTTSGNVSISSKPDTAAIVKQTKRLVQDYNSLHTAISDESGYLNPQFKRSLQNSLNSDALETLGLSKNTNGKLSLNENKLISSINNNYDQVIRSFSGISGIASALSKVTNRLQSSPSEALLNLNNSEYKRYNNYQATLQLYSQLPTSGLLLNNYL